jgi:hypothetical protein
MLAAGSSSVIGEDLGASSHPMSRRFEGSRQRDPDTFVVLTGTRAMVS